MEVHRITNVAVLACAMLLAGTASAVLGLAMRFSMVSLTLLAICLMVGAGLTAALVLYRRGTADSQVKRRAAHKETPAT